MPIHAQENLNLVFYNLLNYPTAPPANRNQILSALIQEMEPDLFMVCELESLNGANEILDTSLNSVNNIYAAAPYINNTSSGSDLQQLLYYNDTLFELVQTDIVQTSLRDINRYRLRLLTEESIFIEIFVAHLKASQGEENEERRLEMVNTFTAYLETLDPDDPVIFAGDLNLYRSTEAAYQELLDPTNAIVLKDPIDTPGNWNNNPSFASVHSQSTRISNNEFDDFGAGGGLDSRFDFILMSENLFETETPITYVNDSYETYGNSGNCYNNRIDDSDCSGIYSSTVRNLLYQMSDHLPIRAQLQINSETLGITENIQEQGTWQIIDNVAQDEIEIAFAKAENTPSIISIYDQTGRLITQIKVGQQTKLILPISNYAEGLYYVTSNNRSFEPLKFLKTY